MTQSAWVIRAIQAQLDRGGAPPGSIREELETLRRQTARLAASFEDLDKLFRSRVRQALREAMDQRRRESLKKMEPPSDEPP